MPSVSLHLIHGSKNCVINGGDLQSQNFQAGEEPGVHGLSLRFFVPCIAGLYCNWPYVESMVYDLVHATWHTSHVWLDTPHTSQMYVVHSMRTLITLENYVGLTLQTRRTLHAAPMLRAHHIRHTYYTRHIRNIHVLHATNTLHILLTPHATHRTIFQTHHTPSSSLLISRPRGVAKLPVICCAFFSERYAHYGISASVLRMTNLCNRLEHT